MKQVRVLVVGVLLGLMLGMGWVYAQQGSRAALMPQDYSEIGQLYATINHGGDFRDADLWLSAFSDDAVFTIVVGSGQEFAGKEALSEWRHQSFRGQVGDAKVRHWDGPPRITPTSEGMANARSYFMVYDVSGKSPTISSSGYHDDVFVKTAEGWRVKSRKVYFDAPPA
jgi:3-phenylpropionate/cinnamic acid dioxygenase small subunit